MLLVKTESSPAPESYRAFLGEIKDRIRSAKYAALRREFGSIDTVLGHRPNDLGSSEGETWGRSVVENLANDFRRVPWHQRLLRC